MMTCRGATQLHTLAEEGALTGTKKLRYELHMKICPQCKAYKATFDATVEALKQVPPEEPPAALVDLLASELEKKP